MKIATRIDRMIDKPDSKLKATASVTLDGLFAVHGIRVVDTEKGLRAMMPSTKYEAKNGETKYSDIFHVGGENMPIVVNLDVMMAKRKMSSGELAEKIGITPANLSILKNNKAKAIRFSTLEKICEVLDCQPGDILEYLKEL